MDLSQYNYLDILLVGIIGISGLVGLGRGLIKELLSLFAWGLSLFLAYTFAEYVSKQYVQDIFKDSPFISYMLAFGGIFLGCLFVLGLINLLLTHLLIRTGLDGIDYILGLVFGIARGVLISVLIVFVAGNIFDVRDEQLWKESKAAPTFDRITESAIAYLPDDIQISLKSLKERKKKEAANEQMSTMEQLKQIHENHRTKITILESL